MIIIMVQCYDVEKCVSIMSAYEVTYVHIPYVQLLFDSCKSPLHFLHITTCI